MIPNPAGPSQDRVYRVGYVLGSPRRSFPCRYCTRRFKSKSGRTQHVRAQHYAESERHAPDTDSELDAHTSESPIPSESLPQPSFHSPSSPVPSHLSGHSYADAHPSPVPSLPQHDPESFPQPSFHSPNSPVPSHLSGHSNAGAHPSPVSSLPQHDPSPVPSHNADPNIGSDMDIDP